MFLKSTFKSAKLLYSLLILGLLLSSCAPKGDVADPPRYLYQEAEIANVGQVDFSLAEFQKKEDQLEFEPVESANMNIGFTSDHYWVRFSLLNQSTEKKTYYLETARPITDTVEFYQINEEGEVSRQVSGDRMQFEDRAFPHRSSIFKVILEPGKSYQFYLHMASDGEVIALPLTLYEPDRFITSIYREQWVYGFFYGVIALAAIVYLFFFSSLQDLSFFYYGFYVIFIGMLQLSLDGYVYQYILPSGGWLSGRMVIFSAMISVFFLGRYAETFLQISKYFRWLPWVFRSLYIITGLLMLGSFFSPTALEISYPVVNQIGLVLLLLIIGSIIALRVKGVKVDPFFIMGISFLVLGFVVFILNNLSIIPNNFFTANGTKIGSGLEVIFLSLSMTNRIRKLKTDKEKSQAIALQKSEEMNDLKSYFMSNMSHELRTPLNAIMGIANEMTKDNKITPLVKSNFEVIKYSSLSLLSSVNDILDFSRIEKGNLQLNFTRFNPVETLQDISENWKAQAQDKGLFYLEEIDENIPTYCYGDADRLRQIVNNILGNAVKFTPKGNIHFEVSVKHHMDNRITLSIMTTDTGVGISEEKMTSIFESFNQQQMDDKRQFGGLGLGLSIVKKLVDLHKGDISIDSKLEEGTQVAVEIDYEKVPEEQRPTHDYSAEEQDLRGARVLVVEDNAINQLIMRKLLSTWKNTEFSIVENGQEALDILQKEVFDIILMDLQMPVMDGYEATNAIRAGQPVEGVQDIPIIAVTADTMEETKEKVFNIGINDYLSKPVKSETLFEKIALQLSRKAS